MPIAVDRESVGVADRSACFKSARGRPHGRLLADAVFCRPGGCCGEPEPDPIPNSAVKLPSADGTKSQDLEE
jgi:hypothetical protein